MNIKYDMNKVSQSTVFKEPKCLSKDIFKEKELKQ